MTRWASHLYIYHGKERGIEAAVVNESLRQAHLLQDNGLPPVLTLGHLSFHTDIPYWKLRTYVARRLVIIDEKSEPKVFCAYNSYRSFQIRKQLGGYRRICVPEPDLMKVQKWIDHYILSQVKASPYSYAFEKGQSIFDCARQHLGCRWLVKLDLRNFFESLSEIQVYRVFRDIGYERLISFEFSRICTKVRETSREIMKRWSNTYNRSIEAYHRPVMGHLPQGAPTSPKLANLIVSPLDKAIATLADSYGLVYTRYADDMTFSTCSMSFNRDVAKKVIHDVSQTLPKYGLRPHTQKIYVVPPGARKVVLGLLVDGDKVRLSKDFRSALECHWYHCAKDPVEHAKQREFSSVLGLKNYLHGLIAYAKQVDSNYVDKLTRKYGEIPWPI
jgi:RNA-directed DNA polymerase